MFNKNTWEAIELAMGTNLKPVGLLVKYKRGKDGMERLHRNTINYNEIKTLALLGFLNDAKIETMKLYNDYIFGDLIVEEARYEERKKKREEMITKLKGLKNSVLFSIYERDLVGKSVTIPKQNLGKECEKFREIVNDLVKLDYIKVAHSSVIEDNEREVENIFNI